MNTSVSCIMPTADRRRFVPRAIHTFLHQDYPNRELIILHDGADKISDLVFHQLPAARDPVLNIPLQGDSQHVP